MSEKMTEEEIKDDMAIVQTLTDTSTGATMALNSLEAELDRARASESEKDAEIARLRADLERLKPTGQVAEDEAFVRTAILSEAPDPLDVAKWDAAVSRLATQAQAAKVLADALRTAEAPHKRGCTRPYLNQESDCSCGLDAALRLVGRLS